MDLGRMARPGLGLLFSVGFLFATGCGPSRVVSVPLPKPPELPPPIASCALAAPEKQAVSFRNIHWIGRAGDRTWALVDNDKHEKALIRIVDGKLVPLALPSELEHSILAVYVRSHYVWILRTNEGLPSSEPRLLLVDVKDAKSPKVGAIESLEPLPENGPREFAVYEERAIFFFGPSKTFLHWDFPSGKPVSAPAQAQITSFDAPSLACGKEGCTSVIVEGDGPTRRMILRSFNAQGKQARTELGPGHVAEWTTAPLAEQSLALWCRFDERGLWGRVYNPTKGQLVAEPFLVSGVEPDLQDPQTILTREGPLLAWQAARKGWRLGRIDPTGHSVNAITPIPLEGSFLTAAAADDGISIAVFTTGTDYDGSSHDWYATASATFVSPGQTEKPIAIPLLADERGPGRGGIAAHAMAAPGYAGVLLSAQGETMFDSSFVLTRKPCRGAAPDPAGAVRPSTRTSVPLD